MITYIDMSQYTELGSNLYFKSQNKASNRFLVLFNVNLHAWYKHLYVKGLTMEKNLIFVGHLELEDKGNIKSLK